ncbi:chloramphenicol O-acetyltransferase [Pseudoalteromonas citrea]|uniref:Chloramphenicol O-acetyltransferase n=2 Tax=Pseudoalteromonas citrea TaxID=43655 RepID=A0AAD4AIE6_9GAMM|nr:CatA-like O-acetyltransferase [Pseudoalteromonas citrea]KAF7770190.1 chloramphenicol O-acetyltransferase [Pseudoalteromonas citrea]
MKVINRTTWPRAAHFEFYKDFSQPYFNVTVDLQVGKLYDFAKKHKVSFTYCYLYCLSQAVSAYEPIRYRIRQNDIVVTEQVTLSTVFLKADDTFRFVPLSYHSELSAFTHHADVSKGTHLQLPLLNELFLSRAQELNQIYVSILPWFKFTSFSHAFCSNTQEQGIPKFVFGKFEQKAGTIPLNIEVHHGLMDGLHVAKFITQIEKQVLKLCTI